ncbi:GT-D fold domain-containing glycosyltransferase [Clostridium lacusfryxellense]|uniref:GT-D fold domain-containing glycosyltransferase n=1 Tax=Clostridium lacusfryxellense TaxID=205328 RepID=UPI001C0C138F|nr:GT-D fold domain-containing glycosyltransferase [Clostridium lacusfryxellense]MBU3111066.1 DUF1792 domain-containing protein [Clostridium lacusfryxellense]
MYSIKKMLKRIIYGNKYSSETYIRYLKSLGMTIGSDCTIYSPTKTLIDVQYPWNIEIGNHVRITQGVIILTHDYSWSVLKLLNSVELPGAILGAAGKVKIGDNVFIGMNAIIIRGVNIGNNVIIGSGSVVTKDCKNNSVYAGNPAKYIMSVEEFYKKRQHKQIEEAKQLAVSYFDRFREMPPVEIFHEYFMIFENISSLNLAFDKKMRLCGNYKESCKFLSNYKASFLNFEEFLKYCFDGKYEVVMQQHHNGIYRITNIKKKIKNLLPNQLVYYYSIVQTVPEYIRVSWKMRKKKYPKIMFYDDVMTVDQIVNEKKSLSRFGDGEFMWMLGTEIDSFQENTYELGEALRNIFQSDNPNLLIGIPYGIIDARKCNLYARMHWKIIKGMVFGKMLPFIDQNKTYSNASITRPYIDYHDREFSRKSFENLKRIWNNRDIVIVEGEKTKLGIGNDLFCNARSIKRILCPAENALSKYEEIKDSIVRHVKYGELILAALGPTATILAADMCEKGYQVVDIGHVDVEYVWYLHHAILREKIEGKYVNESGIRECSDLYDKDKEYLDSIIDRVIL